MTMDDITQKARLEMIKGFTNKGLLIEAGFQGLRFGLYQEGYSEKMQEELRFSFFSGADHLFTSIMSLLETDREPTEADMIRMDMIHSELEEFRELLKRRLGK
jgi:hypothetical protein